MDQQKYTAPIPPQVNGKIKTFYTSYAANAFKEREPILVQSFCPYTGQICFSTSTWGPQVGTITALFRIIYKS